jgi:hypothetical protein
MAKSKRLILLHSISRTKIRSADTRALAVGHAGALAFSRTGDPATGEFQDAVVLAQFGEVALDSLSE